MPPAAPPLALTAAALAGLLALDRLRVRRPPQPRPPRTGLGRSSRPSTRSSSSPNGSAATSSPSRTSPSRASSRTTSSSPRKTSAHSPTPTSRSTSAASSQRSTRPSRTTSDVPALDVSSAADLSLTYARRADEEQARRVTDPHFWLDPMRLADVADEVAVELSQLDPPAQSDLRSRTPPTCGRPRSTRHRLRQGPGQLRQRQLVTSHTAFGYLADAYDLEQVGLTGLSPETEPNPQELAEVTDFVRDNDVRTIFYETLVSPDVAETVANATGATHRRPRSPRGLVRRVPGRRLPAGHGVEPGEPRGGVALPLTPALVELRAATLGYDDATVLRDVDFAVCAGEFVAIVGPNGSGKSTLVKSILGLADRSAGELDLFGVPAEQYRERWRIGYVPQRHTVGGPIPATVREVVMSGRLPRSGLWRLPSAADRSAVEPAHGTGRRQRPRLPTRSTSSPADSSAGC